MHKKDILQQMQNYPPFYQSVWKACMQIPSGQTRTYAQIAQAIGRPGAARAVGTALGKNPFAPDVPCHRVVRSDGQLGGYSASGGIEQKKQLLKAEKSAANNKR